VAFDLASLLRNSLAFATVSWSEFRVIDLPHLAHPLALFLLPLVPPLIWVWLRPERLALRYPDTGALAKLPAGRSARARRWGAILRAVALVFLILGMAGPRWPDAATRIPTEGIAIAMAVDASGSMAETDFTWKGEKVSRLDAVKNVFRLFIEGGEGPGGEHLEGRPRDLLSLVVFGTRPDGVCPLTLNHQVLLELLNREEPRGALEGQTNIGDAIAWGLRQLGNAVPRRRVLVLLTDGEHNVPPPALKPRQAAQLAGNLGVPIYVIDAGGDTPSPLEAGAKESSAVDRVHARKVLQDVAKISGGRYLEARDGNALLEACAHIDQLEKQRIESFQYRRYREGFAWLGLASLVCWSALVVLETTVWRKIP
jgi:Ca-activated chloride channel family protein